MDFTFAQLKSDSEMNAAYFAKVLVHESTHGVVASRGIRYAPELRLRIEKLCVTEENRFLNRLALTHPEIAENLHQDFDPTRWEKSWKISRGGSTLRVFYRLFFK